MAALLPPAAAAGATPGSALIALDGIKKSYNVGRPSEAEVLHGLKLQVGAGEFIALMGPSGSGKSTLLKCLGAVIDPSTGRMVLGGEVVFDNGWRVKDLRARVDRAIRRLDLDALRGRKCGVLSSGEQTRASLAKALISDPDLLLLDEPTASLDPATARDIRLKIREFVAERRGGVLWTSHNMYEVQEICDRVLFLSHGKILLEGDPKVLPGEHGKASLEELFIAVAREPLALGPEPGA